MAKDLQTATIRAPAFYGINTQESDVTLDANYAKIATNCILDEGGRLASRKGWRYATTFLNDPVSVSITSTGTTATVTHTAHGYTSGDLVRIAGATETEYNGDYTISVVNANTYTYTFAGSATSPATGAPYAWLHLDGQDVDLLGMHRFLDIDGAEYFGAWSATDFYIKEGSQLTEVTYSGSQTIQNGNWQAATLNDAAYLFQRAYEPIYFNPTTGILDDSSTATNTATVTITNSNEVTAINSTVVTATNSGTVATVTHVAHGFSTGDTVHISGANETEYNGTFTITVTNANAYTYTMSSSPSGNATGTVIANGKIATITHVDHGYSTGDTVYISNSNPTDFDGTYTITVVDNDTYTYSMSTVPTTDAIDTVTENGNIATVTHVGHGLTDVLTVTITGANESDYNVSSATITIIDSNTYTYVMTNAYSADATGTITASWTKGTPPEANTVLSAYGRLWAANTATNKTTVYWTDVLDGTAWNTGTAGSLDISSILVKGNDEIIALGAHNGNLIIFCTNNIIIMGDADEYKTYIDPNTLQLVEVIHGIGCIARDSVQNIGDDILFLSESGVRSLGRTIQEKSQPLNDLSRNVRDDLLNTLKEEVGYDDIKSVYSDHFAFYLLLFPATKSIYCFDTKRLLDTGAARVTKWDSVTHSNLLGFDGQLYMTNLDGIAEYFGYLDNDSSYTMQYYTAYFDFGSTNIIKILKSVGTTVLGSTGQTFTIKVATDYENQYSSFPVTLRQGAIYYYNIDEYGLTTTVPALTQGASTTTIEWAQPTITGATQANPCVITSVGHTLTTGDEVYIDNVVGMTSLNGNKYTVNVLTANTFELVGIDSTAYTAYTSGGDLTHLDSYTVNFSATASSTYNTAYKVWLDADGFYYADDNGTRTSTILYTDSTEYASEYSGGGATQNIKSPIGDSGFVAQLGFESTINGSALTIQQVDLYVKLGRLY